MPDPNAPAPLVPLTEEQEQLLKKIRDAIKPTPRRPQPQSGASR